MLTNGERTIGGALRGQERGIWHQSTWVQVRVLPLTSYVNSGKLCILSVPQLPESIDDTFVFIINRCLWGRTNSTTGAGLSTLKKWVMHNVI